MDELRRSYLIRRYFKLGLHHHEILAFLALRHNILISHRQLKRILRKLHLFRRKHFSDLGSLYDFIEHEISSSSAQLHGYRWMHLRCIQHGFVVKQETVRILLQLIDPEGSSVRRRCRLRRRVYSNKGPNYLWHIDGYDKLKPYGIAISGCIDGFARYIIWLRCGYTNNDPRVISAYYLNAVETCGGCPRTVRTDLGTENRHIEQMQMFLGENLQRENILPAFIYGTSQHNQRIEAWWSILRKHNAQFWINLFEYLKDNNFFSGNFIDKGLIQFCFSKIIQRELNEVRREWNSHKISSSRNARAPTGKPTIMYNLPELYGTRDYTVPASVDQIEACKCECTFSNCLPCKDKDLFELCVIIMLENNYDNPTTVAEAVDLYFNLRNEFSRLLYT